MLKSFKCLKPCQYTVMKISNIRTFMLLENQIQNMSKILGETKKNVTNCLLHYSLELKHRIHASQGCYMIGYQRMLSQQNEVSLYNCCSAYKDHSN